MQWNNYLGPNKGFQTHSLYVSNWHVRFLQPEYFVGAKKAISGSKVLRLQKTYIPAINIQAMDLKTSIATQRLVLLHWIPIVEWIIKARRPFNPIFAQKNAFLAPTKYSGCKKRTCQFDTYELWILRPLLRSKDLFHCIGFPLSNGLSKLEGHFSRRTTQMNFFGGRWVKYATRLKNRSDNKNLL